MSLKDTKKTIAEVMLLVTEMAKQKKGSFFIIATKDISSKYERLYPELFSGKNINIKDKAARTLILTLSLMDGAIVFDNSGKVLDYGVKIKKTKILFGHGTRHSAARGISQTKDVISIISSEEDGLIRIFKRGELVAEINPDTGKNRHFRERIAELFSKPDLQVATSGGVASLLLGLNPLMAGAIFTGSWIITRYGFVSMKDFLHTGRLIVKKELNSNKYTAKNLKK